MTVDGSVFFFLGFGQIHQNIYTSFALKFKVWILYLHFDEIKCEKRKVFDVKLKLFGFFLAPSLCFSFFRWCYALCCVYALISKAINIYHASFCLPDDMHFVCVNDQPEYKERARWKLSWKSLKFITRRKMDFIRKTWPVTKIQRQTFL